MKDGPVNFYSTESYCSLEKKRILLAAWKAPFGKVHQRNSLINRAWCCLSLFGSEQAQSMRMDSNWKGESPFTYFKPVHIQTSSNNIRLDWVRNFKICSCMYFPKRCYSNCQKYTFFVQGRISSVLSLKSSLVQACSACSSRLKNQWMCAHFPYYIVQ